MASKQSADLQQEGWYLTDEGVSLCATMCKDSDLVPTVGNIIKQAINVDLRSIGAKCLPDSISKSKVFNKPVILQLQKVRNVACESAKQHNNSTSKKILKLQLTDGHTHVGGVQIEGNISGLMPSTPAGTKIKVVSSMSVVNGFLLLTPSNVKVLGGCVEHMVKKWDQQKGATENVNRYQLGSDLCPKFVPFNHQVQTREKQKTVQSLEVTKQHNRESMQKTDSHHKNSVSEDHKFEKKHGTDKNEKKSDDSYRMVHQDQQLKTAERKSEGNRQREKGDSEHIPERKKEYLERKKEYIPTKRSDQLHKREQDVYGERRYERDYQLSRKDYRDDHVSKSKSEYQDRRKYVGSHQFQEDSKEYSHERHVTRSSDQDKQVAREYNQSEWNTKDNYHGRSSNRDYYKARQGDRDNDQGRKRYGESVGGKQSGRDYHQTRKDDKDYHDKGRQQSQHGADYEQRIHSRRDNEQGRQASSKYHVQRQGRWYDKDPQTRCAEDIIQGVQEKKSSQASCPKKDDHKNSYPLFSASEGPPPERRVYYSKDYKSDRDSDWKYKEKGSSEKSGKHNPTKGDTEVHSRNGNKTTSAQHPGGGAVDHSHSRQTPSGSGGVPYTATKRN